MSEEEDAERKQLIADAWPMMIKEHQQGVTDGTLELKVVCTGKFLGKKLTNVNLVNSLTKETVWDKWV